MSLKRRYSFDELVRVNRERILEDRKLMDKIEQNIENRISQSLKESKKEA
ncbi:FbpB family small basic protein [Virgibacillus soli]|uniref:FbpB family small basic protein n=1 Tax=Paracerasibacillus soli TaxID=480284 RepID=A0ABU5CQV4_9BACI|nr:FbpB family small basic protein [Virgibacillus soli]MDY0408236.1 FbpB family small basic protein [Virgibacillus soli]